MLENDENFWEANVYICPPTDPNCSDGDSADEELGTIDNLSRNQLAAEGEATVLRGPHERERIGGYEETEDTVEDTSFSSFPLPISTTPTLTATLSPPGTLEFGPELLLTPLWKPPFDASQRS